MSKSKTDTLGNYICKIGKYDVRQTLILPRTQKTSSGKVTNTGGATEGKIYKGKKLIVGKLSGASDAIKKAFEMTCEEGDVRLVSKSSINKYSLEC